MEDKAQWTNINIKSRNFTIVQCYNDDKLLVTSMKHSIDTVVMKPSQLKRVYCGTSKQKQRTRCVASIYACVFRFV